MLTKALSDLLHRSEKNREVGVDRKKKTQHKYSKKKTKSQPEVERGGKGGLFLSTLTHL